MISSVRFASPAYRRLCPGDSATFPSGGARNDSWKPLSRSTKSLPPSAWRSSSARGTPGQMPRLINHANRFICNPYSANRCETGNSPTTWRRRTQPFSSDGHSLRFSAMITSSFSALSHTTTRKCPIPSKAEHDERQQGEGKEPTHLIIPARASRARHSGACRAYQLTQTSRMPSFSGRGGHSSQ